MLLRFDIRAGSLNVAQDAIWEFVRDDNSPSVYQCAVHARRRWALAKTFRSQDQANHPSIASNAGSSTPPRATTVFLDAPQTEENEANSTSVLARKEVELGKKNILVETRSYSLIDQRTSHYTVMASHGQRLFDPALPLS